MDQVKQAIDILSSLASSSSSTVSAQSEPSEQPRNLGVVAESDPPPCSRVMTALRSVRDHFRPSTSAREEQRKNFAPYSKSSRPSTSRLPPPIKKIKSVPWTCKMVCMAGRNDDLVPVAPSVKITLLKAGLGERKVRVDDIDCSSDEFKNCIANNFPKLKDRGGYEILRCVPNTKTLQLVPIDIAFTPSLLKTVIGAGRIYIRPIQIDLSTSSSSPMTDKDENEVTEKCLICGLKIPVKSLRRHLNKCELEKQMASSGHNGRSHTSIDMCYEDSSESEDIDDEVNEPTMIVQHDTITVEDSDEMEEEVEKAMVAHAISLSVHESELENRPNETESDEPITLKSIVEKVYKSMTPYEHFNVPVRRDHCLTDALRVMKRRTFSPEKRLRIEFLGESGEDGGGLLREFWCLLAKDVATLICEGDETRKCVRHDSLALQDQKLLKVGQLMAMSFIHGGSGFPFFSDSVFKFLCGVPLAAIDVNINEIPDYEVKCIAKEINEATTDNELRLLCLRDDNVQFIIDAGYSRPLNSLRVIDKGVLLSVLTKHYTLLRNKAELDQLRESLLALGIGTLLTEHSEVMKPLFVYGLRKELSADDIKSLLKDVKYSYTGCSEFEKEKSMYMMFLDLLYSCEEEASNEGNDIVPLSTILAFFTGAESIPPMGYDLSPALSFSPEEIFPTSSTCALTLTLPTRYYNQPALFKEKMLYGLNNHGGFGKL